MVRGVGGSLLVIAAVIIVAGILAHQANEGADAPTILAVVGLLMIQLVGPAIWIADLVWVLRDCAKELPEMLVEAEALADGSEVKVGWVLLLAASTLGFSAGMYVLLTG